MCWLGCAGTSIAQAFTHLSVISFKDDRTHVTSKPSYNNEPRGVRIYIQPRTACTALFVCLFVMGNG